MLDACALNPPSAPAIAEPIRFLATLSSHAASTVVLRTDSTTWPGIVASATTEQPRPEIQLTAAAFLSQQTLPDRPSSSRSPNEPAERKSRTAETPFETMFIPIASPVAHTKRAYAYRPATVTRHEVSRPKRVVVANCSCATARLAGSCIQAANAAARIALGKRITGARVIPCDRTAADAPPAAVMALQPRRVEAMRAPSTVANGTW
mmetsp:Transcript_3662/g.10255  ORF Transcript_3662/g.10255 Transcript_3662/m.10255 type:complete len:207 (-) Transcript_3662:318-938(-)